MRWIRLTVALTAVYWFGVAAATAGNSTEPHTGQIARGSTECANASSKRGHAYLYVANTGPIPPTAMPDDNNIAVFETSSGRFICQLHHGIAYTRSLAVSADRSVYVANSSGPEWNVGKGWVSVFNAAPVRFVREITDGIDGATAVAIDARGRLDVANYESSSVSIYDPGGSKPIRVIPLNNAPMGMVAASTNHLVVRTAYSVVIISPDGRAPQTTLYRGSPLEVACDSRGNVYVIDSAYKSIRVFGSRTNRLIRTLTTGVISPTAMTIDRGNNLYVANYRNHDGRSSVTEYRYGADRPERTIVRGLDLPTTLAVDDEGYLYVGNSNWRVGESIAIYAPKAILPTHTITTAVHNVSAMMVAN